MNPCPKTKMHRDPEFLAYIRRMGCLAYFGCEGNVEAHHEDVLKSGGTGIKGHDCQCLPLCHKHHAERHQIGREMFYRKYGIDHMLEIIRYNALYQATKGIK